MGGIHALVAEVPVDLEDALDAADHSALEEELRRDAQVQVDVQRVGAGDKRTCRGTTVQRLQHRRLNLDEVQTREVLAHSSDDLDAGHGIGARVLAHDQVGVAAAHPLLLVHVRERHRQRVERLRGHVPGLRHHGQLAALGGDDAAAHGNDVAQVGVGLPLRQRFFADLSQGEHDLQLGAVAFLQGGEAQLAGVALEHNAAGNGDLVLRLLARFQRAVVLGAKVLQRRSAIDFDGVGVPPFVDKPLPLLPADLLLL